MTNSAIELRFRYTERDYVRVRAMRTHYASRLHLRLDIVLTAIVGACGAYLWRSESRGWGGALIAISGTFAVMLVAAFGVVPYVVFRSNAKFRDDYELIFSGDGIRFRTVHIDSELQWSIYSEALVASHSVVFYYGAHSFTVIPKRAFQSAEQQKAFELLLSQKVAKL